MKKENTGKKKEALEVIRKAVENVLNTKSQATGNELSRERVLENNKRQAAAIELPGDMGLDVVNDTVKLSLTSKAIGIDSDRKKALNMQEDEAAFEGWALIIYTYYAKERNYKIQLALKEEAYKNLKNFSKVGEYLGERGHYYRFLYRALRFSGQYPWFSLDERLEEVVKSFEAFLENNKTFTNNYPTEEKENVDEKNLKAGKEKENSVEDLFADDAWQESVEGKKICDKFGEKIYRQLPVGLFYEEKKKNKAVFTGRKSAIDLWTCDEDSITVFELKLTPNKKVGIISELFFYCNYMRDMYGEGEKIAQSHFKPHIVDKERIKNKAKYRGYYNICGGKFKKINGCMLYDEGNLHQAITEDVLKEMNRAEFVENETPISYGLVEYTVENRKLKIGEIKII